jgi:hypothetical protein
MVVVRVSTHGQIDSTKLKQGRAEGRKKWRHVNAQCSARLWRVIELNHWWHLQNVGVRKLHCAALGGRHLGGSGGSHAKAMCHAMSLRGGDAAPPPPPSHRLAYMEVIGVHVSEIVPRGKRDRRLVHLAEPRRVRHEGEVWNGDACVQKEWRRTYRLRLQP